MADHYVFPAVFDPDDSGGYSMIFPDLPGCITEGGSLDEAFQQAKRVLALHIWSMEDDGDLIPAPSAPSIIQAPDGGFVSLIEAWMPPIRDKQRNRSVNKMLTLPKWLNDMAEKEDVNFSRILQTALKNHLGLGDLEKPRKGRL